MSKDKNTRKGSGRSGARAEPQSATTSDTQVARNMTTALPWTLAIGSIVAGMALLAAGSTTPAAALLVIGYCALVPISVMWK